MVAEGTCVPCEEGFKPSKDGKLCVTASKVIGVPAECIDKPLHALRSDEITFSLKEEVSTYISDKLV